MSVVVKDKAHDFDPGGVALANKLYPQLSMRYRRPPKSVKGKLPKVEWLKGSIKLVANNIFPINMDLHEDLKHFANGTLQTTLFTESNASDDDNEYDWDEEDLAEFVAQFPDVPVPEWGLWAAGWEKGRKLAGLAPRKINPSPGATARYGHLKRGIPGLPHWSWLFDYATPIVASSKRFVAVYRKGEMTGKNHDGGLTRETQFKWPTASDQGGSPQNYEMTVRKLGRQGAYDNVHIHPSMSKHSGGEIIPVPFCCELCMHFHWRWGTVALAGAIDLPLFLGWGNG